jgi:hypothetical protein
MYPIHHLPRQQWQHSNGTTYFPNIMPQNIATEYRPQPAHSSETVWHPTLHTFAFRLLLASFMILFLIAGTIILIYTLAFHRAISPTPTIAVSITFGIIILLFLCAFLLRFLKQRKRRFGKSGENQTKPKENKDIIRSAGLKGCLSRYKKMGLHLRQRRNDEDQKEPFVKRLREKWDSWIQSHPILREWSFRRLWGGKEAGSYNEPFNVYPAPTPLGYYRAVDGRFYPNPTTRVQQQPAETLAPFSLQNVRRSKVSGVGSTLPVIPGSPNVDYQPAAFPTPGPLSSHCSLHGIVPTRPASVT